MFFSLFEFWSEHLKLLSCTSIRHTDPGLSSLLLVLSRLCLTPGRLLSPAAAAVAEGHLNLFCRAITTTARQAGRNVLIKILIKGKLVEISIKLRNDSFENHNGHNNGHSDSFFHCSKKTNLSQLWYTWVKKHKTTPFNTLCLTHIFNLLLLYFLRKSLYHTNSSKTTTTTIRVLLYYLCEKWKL